MFKRSWSFVKGFLGYPLLSQKRVYSGSIHFKIDPIAEAKGFRDLVMDAHRFSWPLVLTIGAEGEEFMVILPPGHQTIEYLANMAAARVLELQASEIRLGKPSVRV
jgi:hypothetical protein